ncbi:hypothetical protein [Halobellus sp. Atlit-38R]|nr:hypothetical protein [Halobellus sp. Atlit-38R]
MSGREASAATRPRLRADRRTDPDRDGDRRTRPVTDDVDEAR